MFDGGWFQLIDADAFMFVLNLQDGKTCQTIEVLDTAHHMVVLEAFSWHHVIQRPGWICGCLCWDLVDVGCRSCMCRFNWCTKLLGSKSLILLLGATTPGNHTVISWTSSAVEHSRSDLTAVRMPNKTRGSVSVHRVLA